MADGRRPMADIWVASVVPLRPFHTGVTLI
jgi:hypothetical protein